MLTLWDLLADPPAPRPPARPQVRPEPRPRGQRADQRSPAAPGEASASGAKPACGADARYASMEREMLARYGVRVRKWRRGTTGVAWQVFYRDGDVSRLIESPRPRGPVSAAVFLHEIGHHAIGFDRYKTRCVEEYYAWRFALEQMEAWDIAITDRVRARVRDSLKYAIDKAARRGLCVVPPEVLACIEEQDCLLGGSRVEAVTPHRERAHQ